MVQQDASCVPVAYLLFFFFIVRNSSFFNACHLNGTSGERDEFPDGVLGNEIMARRIRSAVVPPRYQKKNTPVSSSILANLTAKESSMLGWVNAARATTAIQKMV